MNKPARIALHLRCIATKIAAGKPVAFHIHGILREIGMDLLPSLP